MSEWEGRPTDATPGVVKTRDEFGEFVYRVLTDFDRTGETEWENNTLDGFSRRWRPWRRRGSTTRRPTKKQRRVNSSRTWSRPPRATSDSHPVMPQTGRYR